MTQGVRVPYALSGARAVRNGSSDMCMSPVNGCLNSRIKKIAPAADTEKMKRDQTTTAFVSANKLKLANMMVSQNTNTTRNGVGIEVSDCTNSSKRAFATSVIVSIARSFMDR